MKRVLRGVCPQNKWDTKVCYLMETSQATVGLYTGRHQVLPEKYVRCFPLENPAKKSPFIFPYFCLTSSDTLQSPYSLRRQWLGAD